MERKFDSGFSPPSSPLGGGKKRVRVTDGRGLRAPPPQVRSVVPLPRGGRPMSFELRISGWWPLDESEEAAAEVNSWGPGARL